MNVITKKPWFHLLCSYRIHVNQSLPVFSPLNHILTSIPNTTTSSFRIASPIQLYLLANTSVTFQLTRNDAMADDDVRTALVQLVRLKKPLPIEETDTLNDDAELYHQRYHILQSYMVPNDTLTLVVPLYCNLIEDMPMVHIVWILGNSSSTSNSNQQYHILCEYQVKESLDYIDKLENLVRRSNFVGADSNACMWCYIVLSIFVVDASPLSPLLATSSPSSTRSSRNQSFANLTKMNITQHPQLQQVQFSPVNGTPLLPKSSTNAYLFDVNTSKRISMHDAAANDLFILSPSITQVMQAYHGQVLPFVFEIKHVNRYFLIKLFHYGVECNVQGVQYLDIATMTMTVPLLVPLCENKSSKYHVQILYMDGGNCNCVAEFDLHVKAKPMVPYGDVHMYSVDPIVVLCNANCNSATFPIQNDDTQFEMQVHLPYSTEPILYCDGKLQHGKAYTLVKPSNKQELSYFALLIAHAMNDMHFFVKSVKFGKVDRFQLCNLHHILSTMMMHCDLEHDVTQLELMLAAGAHRCNAHFACMQSILQQDIVNEQWQYEWHIAIQANANTIMQACLYNECAKEQDAVTIETLQGDAPAKSSSNDDNDTQQQQQQFTIHVRIPESGTYRLEIVELENNEPFLMATYWIHAPHAIH